MKSWVKAYLDERILNDKSPRLIETLGFVQRSGKSSNTLEKDLELW